MDVLLAKGEEFGLAQARPIRRDESTENLNQKGLQLLDEVELGEGPVGRPLEKFPELALSTLLLFKGH